METAENRAMKICQIGAGLIGRERITALMNLAKAGTKTDLCGVYDPYLKELPELLQKNSLRLASSLDEIYSTQPDWVFISTPHDVGAEIAKDALRRGHQVLLEKPMGRNLAEAESILACQIRENQLFIGFNYRFYEGIHALLLDLRQRLFGNLVAINMGLGHGGNPKDKTSWKLDLQKAGGGVLIDPGIHLLDLCQYMFAGDVQVKSALSWHGFWNTGIEEEAQVLMQSGSSIINLQLSIVRWRSTFRIEVNGDEGYGIVEGRGKSYGRQRYVRGKRWGWMSGKPQKETEEVVVETEGNAVFQQETAALLSGSTGDTIKPCSGKEALAGMKLLEACRQQAGQSATR
jgi:predicted dehydrogenase